LPGPIPKEDRSGDFTVLGLNTRVHDLLETAFPYPVWLRGEVSSTPRPNSRGHTYFQLIDPDPSGGQPVASLDCVLFAGTRAQAVRDFAREGSDFRLEAGMAVRVLGNVDVWPPGGRYQFVVQAVDPAWTSGEEARRLRRLLEKLTETGVLGENSTLAMPRVPLRIGLVTAENSAACRDFVQTLAESGLPFTVYAAWSAVQGKDTSASVTAAFNALLGVPDLDVAVLTRGGGSATDLNWFNDEAIAITISQLPWPVISGIGHETDTTLPDYAAHTRAKTPTHAASILVDRVADFLGDMEGLAAQLARSAIPCIRTASERLKGLASRLGLHASHRLHLARTALRGVGGSVSVDTLGRRLAARATVLDTLAWRLGTGASVRIRDLQLVLERLSSEIEKRDPGRMLELGWALVRKGRQGGLLTSVKSVSPSEEIDVTMRDGSLTAKVTEVRDEGVAND
jgi:exodeoxyribonuclease VII large subunit